MSLCYLGPRKYRAYSINQLFPHIPSYGVDSTQHVMAEKLAAYRRRAFLIRDRCVALGLSSNQPTENNTTATL